MDQFMKMVSFQSVLSLEWLPIGMLFLCESP